MHGGDVHCHVTGAKHFHTQEHHCPICDFQFPGFDDQTPHLGIPSDNFFFKQDIVCTLQAISYEPLTFFSSRAPPLVA